MSAIDVRTRGRALNNLRRHHPQPDGLSDRDVLQWAATISDAELLSVRNLGKRCLAWIRAHAPDMDGPRPYQVGERGSEWFVPAVSGHVLRVGER